MKGRLRLGRVTLCANCCCCCGVQCDTYVVKRRLWRVLPSVQHGYVSCLMTTPKWVADQVTRLARDATNRPWISLQKCVKVTCVRSKIHISVEHGVGNVGTRSVVEASGARNKGEL